MEGFASFYLKSLLKHRQSKGNFVPESAYQAAKENSKDDLDFMKDFSIESI